MKSKQIRDRQKRLNTATWSIAADDPGYPTRLLAADQQKSFRTLYGLGNREIFKKACLGLICSVQCPGSVVLKTFDAIRELRDRGVVVAGGFHSPMEQQCLEFLLRGEQPVIVCPAKHPGRMRLSPDTRASLEAGRLLLLAPFDEAVRTTNKARAQTRNEFVAALCAALLVPHASAGGKAWTTSQQALASGKQLFTFDVGENRHLCEWGAQEFQVDEVRSLVPPPH